MACQSGQGLQVQLVALHHAERDAARVLDARHEVRVARVVHAVGVAHVARGLLADFARLTCGRAQQIGRQTRRRDGCDPGHAWEEP